MEHLHSKDRKESTEMRRARDNDELPQLPCIPHPASFSFTLPAVGVADGNHGAEDIVPGLWLHQCFVGEHAAVPADVLESAAGFAGFVAEPVARVFDDVDFAVGCVRQAVAAGFVVRAGAEDFAVVLGDVEVDGPWPQGVGEFLVAGIEGGRVVPLEVGRNEAIFRRVVAQHEEERVGHVGLETKRFGPADGFEQLDHVMSAVHAAPADFAFGGEAFAELFGDVARLAERVGDALCVCFWIGGPIGRRAGGVDSHHAVRANADLLERAGDVATFADLSEEVLAG